MKEYVIIDSEGYQTSKVVVADGLTAVNFDASTWIEISDTADYTKKRYVSGAWVDLVVTADDMRVVRDYLMAMSDYTQLTDCALTDAKVAEWATYRQALRDLPSGYTPVASPTYPTMPSA
tara:strand:+ start:1820 stop:2179 length:360 start_codon:yes stop_codon:yes gene_type:complete